MKVQLPARAQPPPLVHAQPPPTKVRHKGGLGVNQKDIFNERGSCVLMDKWYAKFDLATTVIFFMRHCVPPVVIYTLWGACCVYIEMAYPGHAELLRADFAIKTLTFVVGLLTSTTFKESLERYKNCLRALVDVVDEIRSFWYVIQMQLVGNPAAQLLTDAHMVLFVLSLVRYLAMQAGIPLNSADVMVQREFRNCALFTDESSQTINSHPVYAEIVVVSWFRTVGIMDRDLRNRFYKVRNAMHTLLTWQKVRSPQTSREILRGVIHIFLTMLPACGESITTKCFTPVIALVLFALLALAEELEDPFGMDEHDVPWPHMLSTVASVSFSPHAESICDETLAFFNDGVRHQHWDQDIAKKLFGKHAEVKAKGKKASYDSFKINFSHYLSLSSLRYLDLVGGEWEHYVASHHKDLANQLNKDVVSTMRNLHYPALASLGRSVHLSPRGARLAAGGDGSGGM